MGIGDDTLHEMEYKERDVDELLEEKEGFETRLREIDAAILSLKEDDSVAQTLEKNRESAQEGLQEKQREIEKLRDQLQQCQEELQQWMEDNAHSKQVLQELAAIGEDVSEGMAMVDERQQELQQSVLHIQELLGKLENAEAFRDTATEHRDPTLSPDQLALIQELEQSGEMNVGSLELGKTIRSSEMPLMSDLQVEMPVRMDRSYTLEEIASQIQMQEEGLNNMSVAQFVDNYERYRLQKRDPASAAAQKQYVDGLIQGEAYELHQANPKLSEKAALEAARFSVGKGAALHNPDQRAGGETTEIYAYGSRAANSALGGLWGSGHADRLYAQVMSKISDTKMTRADMERTKLDVRLNMKVKR